MQTRPLLAQIHDFAETTAAAWLLSRTDEGRLEPLAAGLQRREEPVHNGLLAPPPASAVPHFTLA